MQSMLPETSPHKAGRRVLGEKTANASLTPATKRIADATSRKSSATAIPAIPFNAPTKTSQTNARDISPEAHHAGQKRTIDQVVEDIKEAESEPRKALISSQSESEQEFEIFDDRASTEAPKREAPATTSADLQAIEASVKRQRDEKTPQESTGQNLENHASRVPTEPAARRIFIQQRAALARSRLQSAMRRVENKTLDHALSQYEANSRRPFLRSISSSSSSASNIQRGQPNFEKQTPTKQKRELLPPLPLQPRARPVRSSAQRTAPSPSSESMNIPNPSPYDEEVEEERVEDDDNEDNDKTPKAQSAARQDVIVDSEGAQGVPLSQESDSLMDKLVKWTQSSTDTSRTIEEA